MARPRTTPAEADTTILERRSPRAVLIGLGVAFALLTLTGVVTVVIPELSDAGDEDEPGAPAESTDAPDLAGAAPAASSAP